jgi:hypothetical protein
MKLSMFFARMKPRRRPAPRTPEQPVHFVAREWADLPIHHPRNN